MVTCDEMSGKFRNQVLLVVIYALAASALWTLLPADSTRMNDLGYFSACPFAPWSTLLLVLLAGGLYVLRQYFLTSPPPPELGS